MRSLLCVLSLIALGLSTTGFADSGLVAHWTFDEGSGDVARDVTGNGHDATLTGTEWVPSPRGHALRFDAREDAARYGDTASMNMAGDMSLAIWARVDPTIDPETCHLLIGDTGWAVERNFSLYLQGGSVLRFGWTDGSTVGSLTAPSSLLNGTWQHVAVVANSTERHATMYIDGEVAGETRMPVPISKTVFAERLTGWFYNGFFTGDIDDIRLYSRALSDDEVKGLCTTEADVQIGNSHMVLDASASEARGLSPLLLRNYSDEPRRVELGDETIGRQEIVLEPGAAREVSLGSVPLEPVWSKRTDLFVATDAAQAARLPVTIHRGDAAETQEAILSQDLYVEPLRVVVSDPWQAEMAPGKTQRVDVDVTLALPAHQIREGSLHLQLASRETGDVALTREIASPDAHVSMALAVAALPWGAYDLTVRFRNAAGATPVSTQRLVTVLPGGKQQIRVLNNLVSELMDARGRELLDARRIEFMNPRDGWVWFSATGECSLRVDGEGVLRATDDATPVEAMRLLPAGRHVLRVTGQPTELLVRAIPALVYNVYPSAPRITPFGSNTWERLGKYTLANINMIESQQVDVPERRDWLAQGKLWIGNLQAPGLIDDTKWTVETMLDVWLDPGKPTAWAEKKGFALDKLSGVQVDEYGPGAHSTPEIVATALSAARASEHPAYLGKLWIPFVGGMYGSSPLELFMKACIGSGWPFSTEVYQPEGPTEEANLSAIRGRFVGVAAGWEQAYPGSMRRTIFTPMYSYLPYCTTNCYPQADFRVHLDMQMQVLATDPSMFGLWGVQPYRSNYVDEEILNTTALLLRHYCIEGNTERMLDDPYELLHVTDPDFAEGTAKWQVAPAEEGSISAGKFEGYGQLEGRYPVGTMGDTFVLLKRSAKAPNVLSQQVQGLKPGRLYSLKVFTGDYADLTAGTSRKDRQVLSIALDGAEVLPGGFSHPFCSARGPQPFTTSNRFWMTYHWLQFRAQGETATLRLSDWADAGTPGGPAGQQMMVNFVELQPVFDPDAVE